ncbi:hypothetical protein AUR64_19480 [Haloprofundus marisrubri]|uniref:DUF4166 domain-containing protein n=1 Tax=Haloprofundus marisrubri TaxID=1514971 RepID=A0A0W1R5A7_9EURY|nr:DUF4166 domain-containing protein [Haloprofundus marisrubri]KTG08412.1 hypothetical protein AUR64_19480 [Haloprofundus marisrubri]
MTGVYERALGDDADDLHPKVHERYALDVDDSVVCVGRGEMDISRGTHVLPALYAMRSRNLLFPEAGRDIPFTVTTVGFRDDAGHEALATIREFRFGPKRRRFDSLTVWDDENERLLDFLGTGGLVASELHPSVEAGALVVEGGRQWLRRDDRYVSLPGPLAASVEVRDRYDEVDEKYHVDAVVENPLAGHILSYRGAFTQETETLETVPDGMRPTRGLDVLPPR